MSVMPITASLAPPPSSDISGIAARVHEMDALRPVPQWLGSNAWVIGEDKTASGKVLFCNDAHMAYAQPSVWYEAHIVCPEVEYYGNHLAGLPFPAIGHSRHHSWGITMFVNDDIDLYRETLDGDQYLHGGQWRDLEVRTETIEVAGGEPVTFALRKTHTARSLRTRWPCGGPSPNTQKTGFTRPSTDFRVRRTWAIRSSGVHHARTRRQRDVRR